MSGSVQRCKKFERFEVMESWWRMHICVIRLNVLLLRLTWWICICADGQMVAGCHSSVFAQSIATYTPYQGRRSVFMLVGGHNLK